jgi:Glyoxalase/Bleomycin resistance protein/Dioxygenase superfamily
MKLAAHLANVYQLGYVTRDIDAACEHFRAIQEIESFRRLEIDDTVLLNGQVRPFVIRLAQARFGDKQIEIIQPLAGPTDFYTQRLDLSCSVVSLHHLGILVHGPETAWADMKSAFRAVGENPIMEDVLPSPAPIHFAYYDTRRAFGHYLEFEWRGSDMQSFFDSMPDQAR